MPKKITGRLRYRQFLDGATTLEGTAGDLIYWPSSYWHIGEPVGGFSITLNVGMFSYQLPETLQVNKARFRAPRRRA